MPAINAKLHPDAIMHAAIYARVSKEEKEEGFTLAEQIRACLDYAQRYGFVVDPDHIFKDDFTGTLASRPAFDALRALADTGAIQAVIVRHIDRLGRESADQLHFARELKKRHIAIYHTGIAPSAPSPQLDAMFGMLSVFSQLERALILERNERGRRERAMQGYPRKQKPAFGYKYVELLDEHGARFANAKAQRHTRGYYVIDEVEAALVRQIFVWYVEEGLATYAICKRLNELGIPTIRDQRGYARARVNASDLWVRSSVEHILRNKVYLGVQVYGERTAGPKKANGKPGRPLKTDPETHIAVAIPPIIDAETFAKARARAALNKERASRSRKHDYLFSGGRITCGVCKLHMGGATQTPTRQYYRCNRAMTGVVAACSRNLSARKLEAVVWRELRASFSDPHKALQLFLDAEARAHQERTDPSKLRATRDEQLAKQRSATLKLERADAAYYDGVETLAQYKAKRAQFEHEHAVATTALAALDAALAERSLTPTERAAFERVLTAVARILATIDTAPLADKRRVIELLDVTIEYHADKQLTITVQLWSEPVKNLVVVTRLSEQSSHKRYTLAWTVAA